MQGRRHRSSTSRSPSCCAPRASTRTSADSAGPGELVAIAGIEDIMIGDTLADPNDPRPLPRSPSTSRRSRSPSASTPRRWRAQVGQEAHRPADQEPARPGAGRQRVGAHAAHRPPRHLGDAGPRRAGAGHPRRAAAPRGVRAHRRQPDVVTKEIDGKLHEPVERVTIDVPGEYVGTLTQALAARARAAGEPGAPRHRLGADGVHRARRAASSGSAPSSSPRPAAPAS